MPTSSALAELRSALARPRANAELISTGMQGLNRLLPDHGWRTGSLVEWLSDPGQGAFELAFRSLILRLPVESTWCVIDPEGTFFALPAMGRTASRCLILRPQPRDVWWTVEQVLRSPGIAATLVPINTVPERVLRRWQRAVESGGGIGMLFRPPSAARERSWSDVRLSVTPVRASRFSRTVRVEVVSCRGRLGGQPVSLELHHAPDSLSVVSELDDSTAANRDGWSLRCVGCVG